MNKYQVMLGICVLCGIVSFIVARNYFTAICLGFILGMFVANLIWARIFK